MSIIAGFGMFSRRRLSIERAKRYNAVAERHLAELRGFDMTQPDAETKYAAMLKRQQQEQQTIAS